MSYFISALIDITNCMYSLSIIPGEKADSIKIRLDNCYKVREYDKMMKVSYILSKEEMENTDVDHVIAQCIIELMYQLKVKEKEMNEL